MPQAQNRADAIIKAIDRYCEDLDRIHREWNVRERLPDIGPAAYTLVVVHSRHVMVRVGPAGYIPNKVEPDEYPTLETLRILSRCFPAVARARVKDGWLSLAPKDLHMKLSGAAVVDEDVSPFIIELTPPGAPGLPSGLVCVEWFAMVGSMLVEFQIQWPWNHVFNQDENARWMRGLGTLDLKYRYYGSPRSGKIASVERNNFTPNKLDIFSVKHFHGEAHLQDPIRFSGGSSDSPGHHVLYWMEITNTEGRHATAEDLADTLDPYSGAFAFDPTKGMYFEVVRNYDYEGAGWQWGAPRHELSQGFATAAAAHRDAMRVLAEEQQA